MFVCACVFTGSCESVRAIDLTREGDIWRLQHGGVQYYSSRCAVINGSYRLESPINCLVLLNYQWEALLRLTKASLRFVRTMYNAQSAVLCININ